MIISLIVAIGKNNEIGKGNALLWSLPADIKHFKGATVGHTIIMGRKTYESIGRPLPNRQNIVITRDTNYTKEGIEVAHSLEEAINISRLNLDKELTEGQEVFIIGGAEIYKHALPIADKLYVTKVDQDFEADTFFPTIDLNIWHETSIDIHNR
ncbi:MAG: dihydrofolate reductase, partial [bacterium]|nr:dihydrofolate reductase [bacterium]